jgi:signal peptidase
MKTKELLKNEYVKTVITLIIVGVIFAVFFFGTRFALRTEHPFLAVASGSMKPTLNVGDLIVVQGVSNGSEIKAAPDPEGDIIVYQVEGLIVGGQSEGFIVHRAVDKESVEGKWYFVTKGDNNSVEDTVRNATTGNPSPLPGVPESHLVGKVVYWVPWVGNIFLFIQTPSGMVLIVLLFAVWVFIEFVYSWKEKGEEEPLKT